MSLALRPKVALVLLLTLLAHESVLASIHVARVRPDALLLLTVLSGLTAGPETGALIGFAAGVLADLTLQTPFGLSALVLTLVGFGAGTLQSTILRSSWWIAPVTAAVGSAVGVGLFVLLGALVGQNQLVQPGLERVVVVAGVVAAMNGVLAAPMAVVVRWSFRTGQPERAYSGR